MHVFLEHMQSPLPISISIYYKHIVLCVKCAARKAEGRIFFSEYFSHLKLWYHILWKDLFWEPKLQPLQQIYLWFLHIWWHPHLDSSFFWPATSPHTPSFIFAYPSWQLTKTHSFIHRCLAWSHGIWHEIQRGQRGRGGAGPSKRCDWASLVSL